MAANIQTQILGATIMELLSGELSDETIAAIDSIKREDVSARSTTWWGGYMA